MLSNYPSGWAGGVVIKGVPYELPNSGKVFWVNNNTATLKNARGGSDGNKGTFNSPFATVDYAVSQCTAARGDVVYVAEGHAETIAATDIGVDVAGVKVINLGTGDGRPTYTFSAAGSTINMSAADTAWVGGVFTSSVLDVASAFTVSASGVTIDSVDINDASGILSFLSIVTTDAVENSSDDLTVTGCRWEALNTTPLAFFSMLEDMDRVRIEGNVMHSLATSGGEFVTLAAMTPNALLIKDNIHNVVGASGTTTGVFLTGSGTSTGTVIGNTCGSLDTTTELMFTAGTGLKFYDNLYTGTADASGKLLPAVDG